MRIGHNIEALNVYNRFSQSESLQVKSMEKLSSGIRINKAGDDAAGLAISEKMRGQIRGLSQASKNAQDAISFVQTAEGAASVIHDMLQRGRELAVQAANDTLTDSDREAVNNELTQLKEEITKIANNTEFNTIKMLNKGSYSSDNAALIATIKDRLAYWIDDSLGTISTNLGISPTVTPKNMTVEFYEDSVGPAAASMGTNDGGNTLRLRINLTAVNQVYNSADDGWGQVDALIAHEIVHALQFTELSQVLAGGVDTWFIEGMATAIQGGVPFLNALTGPNSNASIPTGSTWTGDYGSAYAAVMTLHEITTGGLGAIVDRLQLGDTLDQALANTTQSNIGEFGVGVTSDFTNSSDFATWFNSSGAVDNYLDTSADFTNPIGTIAAAQGTIRGGVTTWEGVITNNLTIDNGSPYNLIYTDSSVPADKVTFHIGSNSSQTIQLSTVDISSEGLAINSADLTTRTNADSAIGILDAAINKVSSIRSSFGASQNRLEHSIKNLNNSEENLISAESRIRDVDMAKEMITQTKQSILSQASQAMLAQANKKPQMILQLIS